MSAPDPRNCWIVTDGAAGNENQCLALAHYMGLDAETFRISISQPWKMFAPHLRVGARFALPADLQKRLSGTLPAVLMTAGRHGALAALIIKRVGHNQTFCIQLLDPRIDPAHFDIVICPRHDQLTGPNVITTLGALHRIDKQSLKTERLRWAAQLEVLPAPRIAILIGASNSAYAIDRSYVERMADTVDDWIKTRGGSVMVTTSRRTPESLQQVIRQRFSQLPGSIWTGPNGPDNPYRGFLAWADRFVVSADSVNLLSEACGTGKPVYCHVPQSRRPKFTRFHQYLKEAGLTLPLDHQGQAPACEPLRETARIAQQLVQQIDRHG